MVRAVSGCKAVSATVRSGTGEIIPIGLSSGILSVALVFLSHFLTDLAADGGQKFERGQTVGRGSYPDEEGWAEPCDPPEFRRFLDLRRET